ncbi:hypothetical protein Pyn_37143 [Prunus yedoensis var. nudiflora]|uniref:Uncharacterized protein n=1 Tax=Prunus yedoensis var. nudiflora TaxID=2094558 RepID=A0A314Y4H9_PRUYE|nr:hypothetical protein Pyn_37143 [Prunus yedoensis var. nudiflora]
MPFFKDLHAYLLSFESQTIQPSPSIAYAFTATQQLFFAGSSSSFCPNSLHLIVVVALLATLDVIVTFLTVVLVAFNRSLVSFPSRIHCLIMMLLMPCFLMDFLVALLHLFGVPSITPLVIMPLCVIIDSLLHIFLLL